MAAPERGSGLLQRPQGPLAVLQSHAETLQQPLQQPLQQSGQPNSSQTSRRRRPWLRLPPPHRLARVTELCVCCWALGTTALTWAATAATPRHHAQQGALLACELAYLAVLTLVPEPVWLRHRVWILGVVRIATALVPVQRSATEGSAVLLQRPAQEGWAGAVADWIRVGAGTRLLVHAGCACVVQLPPLALLVQQVALMALTANPRGYCSTPLLADPAWRRRTHAAHRGLDVLPVSVLPLAATGSGEGTADRQLQECMAVLTMQQVLVGVLLPLLLSLASGAASLACPPAGPERPVAEPRGQGMQSAPAWWRGACDAATAARRAWGRADSALASLLSGDSGGDALQMAVCGWLLLGNIWMVLSVTVAQ